MSLIIFEKKKNHSEKCFISFRFFLLTVRTMMFGGFMGYSAGKMILPWYTPPSKSVSLGPRTVKCHSKRLSSSGWAWYSEVASESSWASRIRRFTAGKKRRFVMMCTRDHLIFHVESNVMKGNGQEAIRGFSVVILFTISHILYLMKQIGK